MIDSAKTTFRPGVIVQRLREIQHERGYLPIGDKPPEDDLHRLAEELRVPLYRIQEVASFFPHFLLGKTPPTIEVKICRDMSCHLAGSTHECRANLQEEFSRENLAKKKFPIQDVQITGVSCLGRCDRTPVALISRHGHAGSHHGSDAHSAQWQTFEDMVFGKHLDEFKTEDEAWDYLRSVIEAIAQGQNVIAHEYESEKHGSTKASILADMDIDFNLYRNANWMIDPYTQEGESIRAYGIVLKYLEKYREPIQPLDPSLPRNDETIRKHHPALFELQIGSLLGMGGAGAPAFRKWLDVWDNRDGEKYIVCNGDESEPGTFKDREILLRKPHLLVEGVILAGLMLNAKAGYIFIRHEYEEGIHQIREAIKDAEFSGVCGPKLAQDFDRHFVVDVFVSPGGYICGEQGALLEAMSDRRAQPRNRPPEPQANGLNDKPTVVNNVETLAWIPAITHYGGEWYQKLGYRSENQAVSMYQGRRFFSISGDVQKPGVYEVPIGMPLKNLIYDAKYAGGILHPGHDIYAVAASGPSAGFLPRVLPHDDKSTESEITKLKDSIRFRSRQIEVIRGILDELRLENLALADSNESENISLLERRVEHEKKSVLYLLDCSAKDFDKWDKEAQTQNGTSEPTRWKTLPNIPEAAAPVPKASASLKVIHYSTATAKPKTKEPREAKSVSIREQFQKKYQEWATRLNLDERILDALERLKNNNYHIEELPLDLNVFRNVGRPLKCPVDIFLGAGIVIYDTTRKGKLKEEALNLSEFFAQESCGKCVPCRLGSDKLVTLGTDLLAGKRTPAEVKPLVDELSFSMKQTSICSLGTSASNAFYSIFHSFPEELKGS